MWWRKSWTSEWAPAGASCLQLLARRRPAAPACQECLPLCLPGTEARAAHPRCPPCIPSVVQHAQVTAARPLARRCATWDCKLGNLDFSNQAFLELTGLSPDRVKIEWQFTSCTPYTAGNIRVRCARWRRTQGPRPGSVLPSARAPAACASHPIRPPVHAQPPSPPAPPSAAGPQVGVCVVAGTVHLQLCRAYRVRLHQRQGHEAGHVSLGASSALAAAPLPPRKHA